MDYDYVYKLLLIGDSGVGKSNILLQFADGVFSESHITTIGVDFRIQTVKVGSSVVKLQIWDTAGQDRFKTIVASHYRGALGIMLVYDVTDAESFDHVQSWLEEVNRYCSENVVLLLIGNKKDLDARRVVHFDAGKALADKLGISFLETSAKDTTNVEPAFMMLTSEIKSKMDAVPSGGERRSGIKVHSRPVKGSSVDCCRLL